MNHYIKLVVLVIAIIALSGAWCTSNTAKNSRTLEFNEFITKFELNPSVLSLKQKQFGKNQCTPLPDEVPFQNSIQLALAFIKTKVDKVFYEEANHYLKRGIHYTQLKTDKDFPFSAYYVNQKINLYPSLFEYGCLEDIVSTLVHEMVHAIQHGRYKTPGYQVWEHSLKGNGLDKVVAEIEADAYQLYVSEYLNLLSGHHLGRVIEVSNKRIEHYRSLIAKPKNQK